MRQNRFRLLTSVPMVAALSVGAIGATSGGGIQAVRAGDLSRITPAIRAHVSGFASSELDPASATSRPRNYFPQGGDACALNLGANVKVNQNCLNVTDADLQGRGQAQNETYVAQNPADTGQMIASYNDYRRGDGNCYTAYSADHGRSWQDSTVPMSFTRGTFDKANSNGGADFGAPREYWHAGGDTSVAWDSKGNAYLSCQVFNRGQPTTANPDLSSAFLVFRSTKNGGASFNFPGRYVTVNQDVGGTTGILEDKQFMTVDNNPKACAAFTAGGSCTPFQDRIYVTWTEFTATTAYIYESYSNDYGEHFSPRHLLSPATTNALCPFPASGGQTGCDNNQASQPFVGPDGALYVTWDNYNTVDYSAQPPPATNPGPAKFQVLIAKSVDGGNTFSAPRVASYYYELPDCPTYQGGQNPGRACVPEKGASMKSVFRAFNYPFGAVNPTRPNQLTVSTGSYINPHSNPQNGCVPTGSVPLSTGGLYTGVKTGACNNDILISVSNDGGLTWSAGADPAKQTSVTTAPEQATTDQWFQGLGYDRKGHLAVSYYDRQYGNDETNGFSDVSLSASGDSGEGPGNSNGDHREFSVRRVTSGSMPPPTQFPNKLGNSVFWGDYAIMSVVDEAYPIWSDTRDRDVFLCNTPGPGKPPALCNARSANGDLANDQDAFGSAVSMP